MYFSPMSRLAYLVKLSQRFQMTSMLSPTAQSKPYSSPLPCTPAPAMAEPHCAVTRASRPAGRTALRKRSSSSGRVRAAEACAETQSAQRRAAPETSVR